MLQVPLSDFKLIGTVPAVINDAGNELISVLGSNCMQHWVYARVGHPTVIPYGLCIHLIKCKVIGRPVQRCPINHDWVKCLRLKSASLRGSPGVLMWYMRRWWNLGIPSTARASFTPLSYCPCRCTMDCVFGPSQPANNCVCLWCSPPTPFLTASQTIKDGKKRKRRNLLRAIFWCSDQNGNK